MSGNARPAIKLSFSTQALQAKDTWPTTLGPNFGIRGSQAGVTVEYSCRGISREIPLLVSCPEWLSQ